MAWLSDGKRIEYCQGCPLRGQDCKTCDWGTPPPLLEANRDALDLWRAVRTQWRASGFGLIGLDYPAVRQEAEEMGIDFSVCNKGKIKALESWYLDRNKGE